MVSVETAQCYIHDILLLESYQRMRHEATAVNAVPITYNEVLDHMQIRTVSLSMACRCLSSAGLKIKTRQKSYYNDRHENPECIHHRAGCIESYFKWEKLLYRWVQISAETAIMLDQQQKEKLLKDTYAFEYIDATTGTSMQEYHIDVCPTHFESYISPENKCHHTNLSHRFPMNQKPVIIIRQDESIFKQYSFSTRT